MRGMGVADRAEPGHGDWRLGVESFHGKILNGIRSVNHAFYRSAIDSFFHAHGLERRADKDRLADYFVLPSGNLAAGVQSNIHFVQKHGAISAALNVVFAGPYEMNGSAATDSFYDLRNLEGPVPKWISP